jgi:hypothetical protein
VTEVDPQTSLYEVTVEDDELEKLLEQRQDAKEAATVARTHYNTADDAVKAKLSTLDLGDGAPVRVGRFVVARRPVKGRAVSFETGDTTRLTISLLPDDE